MDKGIRATNYITDYIIVLFVSYFIILFFDLFWYFDLVFYTILFFYYLIFEYVNGQTFGKMITNTKVVKKDGSKPSFIHILFRSFWRMFPVDVFTYLFGYEIGMHDILSSTRLKKIK